MPDILMDSDVKSEQRSAEKNTESGERKLQNEAINSLGDKIPQQTGSNDSKHLPTMELIMTGLKDMLETMKKMDDGQLKPYPYKFIGLTKERAEDPLYGKKTAKEAITPDAVAQGNYGDCFFESAVASMANSAEGKQKLQDMIKTNKDGTYTVTFPGDKDHPVNVTKEDLNNPNIRNKEMWANVMETAYLKKIQDGKIDKDMSDGDGISAFGDNVGTRNALQLLTGENATTDQFAPTDLGSQQITIGATSPENVKRDLKEALEDGQPVTAGASLPFTKFLAGHDPGPLVEQHVYSVLDYDEKSGKVTVRNPWGEAGGELGKAGATVDGVTNVGGGKLEMSFGTFMKYFSDMNVAGKNPYLNSLENLGHTALDVPGSFIDAVGAAWDGDWGKAGGEMLNGLVINPAYIINEAEYAVTKPLSDGLTTVIKGGAGFASDAKDFAGDVAGGAGDLASGAGDALSKGWNSVFG